MTTARTTGNLSQTEAAARTAALDIHSYNLHLDLSQAAQASEFNVRSTIRLVTSDTEFFVDYLGNSVEEVLVNGKAVDGGFDGARIYLTGVPVGEEVTVEIAGTSAYSRTGQGLHRMEDTADGNVYLYSHLEPSDARRIFPCVDQPDLKAVFHTTMVAPAGWAVLSNQPEMTRAEHDGAVTVDFAPTPKLSTYLTSFAAGPYVSKHKTWKSQDGAVTSELGAWARASMAEYLDDEILELTAQGMDFFHKNYGYPYPWGGKYDSIFVPEYNLGAMENPGLVTFTERYLFRSHATRPQRTGRANTILHEMSHMWFGDLVTPRWWDDLWLKESFAEFMGADARSTPRSTRRRGRHSPARVRTGRTRKTSCPQRTPPSRPRSRTSTPRARTLTASPMPRVRQSSSSSSATSAARTSTPARATTSRSTRLAPRPSRTCSRH